MYSYQHLTIYLSCLVILGSTISSAPTSSLSSDLPDTDTSSSNVLEISNKATEPLSQPWIPQNPNNSDTLIEPASSPANTSTALKFTTVTWPITATLSLHANIGPWRLPQARILETLILANNTVGKKPAAQLLERKFTQEQGSRLNTMIFEIGPGYTTKKLTWGDVAEVLTDKGLPSFFERYGVWTSTYFDVVDSERGMLGQGAVRKWYQLVPPVGGGNGTGIAVGRGDVVGVA